MVVYSLVGLLSFKNCLRLPLGAYSTTTNSGPENEEHNGRIMVSKIPNLLLYSLTVQHATNLMIELHLFHTLVRDPPGDPIRTLQRRT